MKLLKISILINLGLLGIVLWLLLFKTLSGEGPFNNTPDSDWAVIKSYLSSAYNWDRSNYLEKQSSVLALLGPELRSLRIREMESEFEKIQMNQVSQKMNIVRAVKDLESGQYFVLMKSIIKEARAERDIEWVAKIELQKSESAFQWEVLKFEVSETEASIFSKNWLAINHQSEILVPCTFQSVTPIKENTLRYFLDFDRVSVLKFSVISESNQGNRLELNCKEKVVNLDLNLNDKFHTIFINGSYLKWIEKKSTSNMMDQDKRAFKTLVEKHFGIENIKK